MPRKYNKKKNPTYTLETLKKAVNEVKNGTLNAYQASKKYAIPRMTIVDRVKLRRGIVKETKGRPTRIDPINEKRLANGLRTMEKYGFGLSSKETTIIVTKFIKQNKIKTDFKDDTPGYDWFAGFRKRQNLSLKKPQAVEFSRKAACDPFIIKDYFDTLENCIEELNLHNSPEKIWNLDESSFSKDPEKTKVVGARGFASTRTIASAGKDNTTILFTANANGEKLPPLIIFRGKNIWDLYMSEKTIENTSYVATKRGWIESKVFEKYMLQTVLPRLSKDSPCLLVYDGHSTHIQLNILENAAKVGVTIIKLPSHASHLLQPLDLAVFKSMKDRWDAKILQWQRLNVGAKLQRDKFSEILGEVWQELNPQIIRNGFKKGGLYPLNKNAIPDENFDPDSLERFYKAKSQEALKKVPTLSNLCLKTLENIHVINAPAEEERKEMGQKIEKLLLKPSEIIIQGTGAGPSRIKVIENKKLENEATFESLLLETIKKSENVIKAKKRKAAKECEIITRETFLEKLRSEEKEKKKKEEEKENRKKDRITKKTTKKDIKLSSKAKKGTKTKKRTKAKEIDWSEESSVDDDVILSDDSHLDWNTYCEYLYQDDQENSDEPVENQDIDEEDIEHRAIQSNDTPDKIERSILDDIYEPNINRRRPKVDDWLLVKFATKKTVKHFVGNVISMIGENPNVKYLRMIRNSKIKSFHYPDVEDISEVKDDSDIVMFLEKPVITRRGHVIFKEDFKSYNIQ